MRLPALPAPAADTVSASLEDMVRRGKNPACVDVARCESVARFGRGARLVAVVVGYVDERRHQAPTSSADVERRQRARSDFAGGPHGASLQLGWRLARDLNETWKLLLKKKTAVLVLDPVLDRQYWAECNNVTHSVPMCFQNGP